MGYLVAVISASLFSETALYSQLSSSGSALFFHHVMQILRVPDHIAPRARYGE